MILAKRNNRLLVDSASSACLHLRRRRSKRFERLLQPTQVAVKAGCSHPSGIGTALAVSVVTWASWSGYSSKISKVHRQRKNCARRKTHPSANNLHTLHPAHLHRLTGEEGGETRALPQGGGLLVCKELSNAANVSDVNPAIKK